MTKDQEQKMLKYIDALEGVNEQLVFSLKHCMRLLSELQPTGETKTNWNKMFRDLEGITGLSDNIVQNREDLFH